MPVKLVTKKGSTVGNGPKWDQLREEYFERMLNGDPITLKDLAEKYGFSHNTVKEKSSDQKWAKQIIKLKEQREQLIGEKLAERTSLVIDKLNDDFATNEVEIRRRHALIARGLQIRAVKRLKEIDMKDFGPRDALAMLKLGLDEERRALGLPEFYVGGFEDKAHPEYRPVAEQIGGHKKVQAIGLMLLKALKDQTQDIEDVGLEQEL